MYNVIPYLLYELHDQLGFRESTYQGLGLSMSQLTWFLLGCSHSSYIHIALSIIPTQTCVYVLGVPQACSYPSHPHSGVLRPAYPSCMVPLRPTHTHHNHIQGLLRPAHIYCTQGPSGLLVPVIPTSRAA